MIFIPLANILNISIILMMIIAFFNYSSAKKSKLLYQYVIADDKNYNDYYQRANKPNEKKLTVFEFYVTKYNLEVKRILLLESNKTQKSLMDEVDIYCKNPEKYKPEEFSNTLNNYPHPEDKTYHDPVVETNNYCRDAINCFLNSLLICFRNICVNDVFCTLTTTRNIVQVVPDVLIKLKKALENNDENDTPRPKGFLIWLGFNKQEYNEGVIEKIGKILIPNEERAFYKCILKFKNNMIKLNRQITGKIEKEQIFERTTNDDPFSKKEKKEILEYEEIGLLKMLSNYPDGIVNPEFINFWVPILTREYPTSSKICDSLQKKSTLSDLNRHELAVLNRDLYQKNCKEFLNINLNGDVSLGKGFRVGLKFNIGLEVSKNKKPKQDVDKHYVEMLTTCRAVRGEKNYSTYVLRLINLDCMPLPSLLWNYELKLV